MTTHAWHGRRRVVIIYCRISDDREGRRYGVARQERDCRALAQQLGWEIAAVLIENDTSAYRGKPRPRYDELLAMLRDGAADAVIALTSRRLQRRFREAFDFLDLVEERGIQVAAVKGGAYDLTTADGRREARRKAVDDQFESEEMSERIRDAKTDNLREGTYRGGPRPFGYEADGTTVRSLVCPACGVAGGFAADRICPACGAAAVNAPGSEAWHIETAMDQLLALDSLRSVCRTWQADGVRTVPRRRRLADGTRSEPVSGWWRPSELRGLVLRPRNAGLIDHRGEIVGPAAWAPIVSEAKWQAVRTVLCNPDRRVTTGNGRRWLGSDLYRCGLTGCGQTMRCSTSGTAAGRVHVPAYQCRAGAHVVRTASTLDGYVEALAVERLSRPDAADLFMPAPETGVPSHELATRANMLHARLDQYGADYADDLITRKQLLDGTARTRAKIAAIEAEMTRRAAPALARLPLGQPEIRALWSGYSLDRRRAVIRAIMTVTVLPARRGRPHGFRPGTGQSYFDPEAVRIDWRGSAG